MEQQLMQEQLLHYHPKTSFTIISKGRVINIDFDEVVHISKCGDEVYIYTYHSEFRTRYSLQDILNDLPVNDFFRVHRSHIISLRNIAGIEKNKINIRNKRIPISKYYKRQAIKRIGHLLNQQYSWFSQV